MGQILLKRRWLAAGVLVSIAVLVMGAARVSYELREQPRRCFRQVHDWREWSQAMLTTVPGGERAEWQNAADQAPLVLLQACCQRARL